MSSKISKWVCLIVVGCIVSMSSASVLTVGKSGAMYTTLIDALDAANPSDTVQFIDSETYLITGASQSYDQGLIIESAPGQRATLNFSGGGWTGLYLGATDMTVRNLNIESERDVAVWCGNDNPTIYDVSVKNLVDDKVGIILQSGAIVSYSTFLSTSIFGGNALQTTGLNTTIDHCSFSSWTKGIIGSGDADVTNSVFGNMNSWGGAYCPLAYATGTEDYNAYSGCTLIADGTSITSGGNTIDLGATSVYAGDPAAGDWSVIPSLYSAASDGTTIGAWQAPEPAMMTIMTVGAIVGLRKRK